MISKWPITDSGFALRVCAVVQGDSAGQRPIYPSMQHLLTDLVPQKAQQMSWYGKFLSINRQKIRLLPKALVMRISIAVFLTFLSAAVSGLAQDLVFQELRKHIVKARIYNLHDGYSSRLEILDEEVFFKCFYDQEEIVSIKIGAGGSVTNWKYRDHEFVAPPNGEEITDRVIQWTVWSDSVKSPPESGANDLRYNLTQAGTGSSHDIETYPNSIAPIFTSIWYEDLGVLDVFSRQSDQWNNNNQQFINGGITALTRYAFIRDGKLLVRRFLLIEPTYLANERVFPDKFYIEGWTPVSRSRLNALAVAVDTDGLPAWYYHADFNIPYYPAFPFNNTYGYAIAYILPKMRGLKMCVLYGLKSPSVDSSVRGLRAAGMLNTMSWDTGMGLLPAMSVSVPGETHPLLINQNLILFSTDNTGSQFKKDLDLNVGIIPRNFVNAGGDMGPETALLRSVLESFSKRVGQRLVKLGGSVVVQDQVYTSLDPEIGMHPGITVDGEIGDIIEIWASSTPDENFSWELESIFALEKPKQIWYDPDPASYKAKKFYRAFRKH